MAGESLLAVLEFACTYARPRDEELLLLMVTISSELSQFMQHKQAEESLRQAHNQAIESVRFKSEFMANMSHEIRTPRNAILGMTQILRRGALSPEQEDCLQTMNQAGQALLEVINEVLDFSKVEAGRFKLGGGGGSVVFDLRAAVEGVVGMLSHQAESKGLELSCRIAENAPALVRGDPTRLRQILTNLVGNAVKFTQKGKVVVRVTKEEEMPDRVILRFSVQDTGIGISPQNQERLFQPFFSQADASTTRQFGGTGLRAAISKIRRAHGGNHHAVSQAGRGSTFYFVIPFAKQAAGAPLPAELIKPAVTADQKKSFPVVSFPSTLRVLVVEDNPAIKKSRLFFSGTGNWARHRFQWPRGGRRRRRQGL